MSLAEARLSVIAGREEGIECPCCGQFAKVYRRKIHATMASALVVAYRRYGLFYGYVPDVLNHRQNADFAKLYHWNLIDPEPGEREDGSRRTGRWRVTTLGEDWIQGISRVREYARIYNGECIGFDGNFVGLTAALGDRFDFTELMEA